MPLEELLSPASPAVRNGRSISFELFPPTTESGEVALWNTVAELDSLQPDFVSVTYGASGSSQGRTIKVVRRLSEQTCIPPVGHLTCVGASREVLVDVIEEYGRAGVRTILALRGDPPGGPGAKWIPHPDGLNHADELVSSLEVDPAYTNPSGGAPV